MKIDLKGIRRIGDTYQVQIYYKRKYYRVGPEVDSVREAKKVRKVVKELIEKHGVLPEDWFVYFYPHLEYKCTNLLLTHKNEKQHIQKATSRVRRAIKAAKERYLKLDPIYQAEKSLKIKF